MKEIEKYKWSRMTDEEVINFWEEHNYAQARYNRGRVAGWGFPTIEALNNFCNCEEQMIERGLL